VKIIDGRRPYVNREKARLGSVAVAALLEAEQPEDIAERLLQAIEANPKTPRGSTAFFRAVKRTAAKCAPELRAALFLTLVTR
jgi:hypothetical protein